MSTDKAERRARTAELFQTALGPRWRVRVAVALDMEKAAVRRLFAPPAARDDAPSAALLAVAELLAATPPRDWPARWRET